MCHHGQTGSEWWSNAGPAQTFALRVGPRKTGGRGVVLKSWGDVTNISMNMGEMDHGALNGPWMYNGIIWDNNYHQYLEKGDFSSKNGARMGIYYTLMRYYTYWGYVWMNYVATSHRDVRKLGLGVTSPK